MSDKLIQVAFILEASNEDESADLAGDIIQNLEPFITEAYVVINNKYPKTDGLYHIACNIELVEPLDPATKETFLQRISDKWFWDDAKINPITDKKWATIVNPKLHFASFLLEGIETE